MEYHAAHKGAFYYAKTEGSVKIEKPLQQYTIWYSLNNYDTAQNS